tara:strand:- start:749 stop:886 length:138 start_codon:yes stop_codon:yes gene_type:complete
MSTILVAFLIASLFTVCSQNKENRRMNEELTKIKKQNKLMEKELF